MVPDELNPFQSPRTSEPQPKPKVRVVVPELISAWVALFVLCFLVAMVLPPLNLALGAVLFPTSILVARHVAWRRRNDLDVSFGSLLPGIAGSFGICILGLVASSIAFVSVCFPAGLIADSILPGTGERALVRTIIGSSFLGGIAAIGVFVLCVRLVGKKKY